MFESRRFCFSIAVILLSVPAGLSAQEMRVYTTVRNLTGHPATEPADKAPVLTRSLTLFHAGKVYDYVDTAREVTVYEPSHNRFTLLSERRGAIAEVSQDEVRQYLALVEQEAHKRLDTAGDGLTQNQIRSLSWLKFQLKPTFEASFNASRNTLTLTDNSCRYLAEGLAPPIQEVVPTYLRFADAAAELNSVLHPQAVLPRPRHQLNEHLRQHQLLPVIVDLQINLDRPLHLQARHEWTWKFQSTDRQLISSWEALLHDTNQRRLSFRQYQLELLGAEVARSR